jgi:hypothetical protein
MELSDDANVLFDRALLAAIGAPYQPPVRGASSTAARFPVVHLNTQRSRAELVGADCPKTH